MGFRYRALYAAQSLGLTGWVKNLWDGRVELEVQGDRESVGKMVEQIYEGHFISIDEMESEEIPVIKESSFSVR